MGLFGPKKEAVMPKVSDVFSAQDLQQITDVIGPKQAARGYGKYEAWAVELLEVAKDPDRQFTKREWNGAIYAAGIFTKVEPGLAPALKDAIARFHAFGK